MNYRKENSKEDINYTEFNWIKNGLNNPNLFKVKELHWWLNWKKGIGGYEKTPDKQLSNDEGSVNVFTTE